jgi:hypothetical protein
MQGQRLSTSISDTRDLGWFPVGLGHETSFVTQRFRRRGPLSISRAPRVPASPGTRVPPFSAGILRPLTTSTSPIP